MSKLFARNAPALLLQGLKTVTKGLYAAWAWLWLITLGVIALPCMMVLPSAYARRAFLKVFARLLLGVIGVRLSSRGMNNIPNAPCIVASNHQSYTDAIVLTAALPARFVFVAKRDFLNARFFRWFFTCIGALSLDRHEYEQGERDLELIVSAVREGMSLVFFPEGGFWRDRERQAFKSGAFVVAAKCEVPIVPLALKGTRNLLREGSWLPVPHPVVVQAATPIRPGGTAWKDIVACRNQVEAHVTMLCDERAGAGS